jgi:phage terminase small subunit
MPRGGHSKVGPIQQDAATRALRGSKERPQHRSKGDLGELMVTCAPPVGLSKQEQAFWNYYAPQLVAAKRLPLKARDALAKYCTALAVVADLRKHLSSRKRQDLEQRSDHRKELRQWLLASRMYENDLLLNPASLIRAPRAEGGGGGGSVGELGDSDPFDDFDEADQTPQ